MSRNDAVFSRATTNSFMQVIFRGSYWIRSEQLFKEEERDVLKMGTAGNWKAPFTEKF